MVRAMSYEIQVLRALLRLARRRDAGSEDALLDRVGGTSSTLHVALRRLEKQELVERLGVTSARLTLSGFAVAVAAAKLPARPAAPKPAATPKPAARPRRRVRAA
jgi:RIO-like serine/threonine protein kinase